jgi:hypothetical protein
VISKPVPMHLPPASSNARIAASGDYCYTLKSKLHELVAPVDHIINRIVAFISNIRQRGHVGCLQGATVVFPSYVLWEILESSPVVFA